MSAVKILLTPSADWFTASPNLASFMTVLKGPLAAATGLEVTVDDKALLAAKPSTSSSHPTFVVEVAFVGGEAQSLVGTAKSDPALYDTRVVLDITNASAMDASAADIAGQIQYMLTGRDYTFVSTRAEGSSNTSNAAAPFGFLEAVKEGLCKDGGLFMPRNVPTFSAAELAFLCAGAAKAVDAKERYHRTAQFVVEKLVGVPQQFATADTNVAGRYGAMAVPSPTVIASCVEKAYVPSRWNNLEHSVSPLTPLLCGKKNSTTATDDFANLIADDSYVNVLEQYHGPTAAFKDFALQLFPGFFAVSTADDPNRYMILAATSGDTGVAAINGFLQNGAPDTKVMVLFPETGVSPVQKAQMLSLSDGKRVQVVGLGADFDYCQATVKRIFNDKAIAQQLLGTSAKPTVLSSANSINWGRLLPQIVYYVHAYVDLVTSPHNGQLAHPLSTSGALPAAFDVVVPSGNFGNILSCYVAKQMGLPVRRFVVASNENDVLADFINTGVYDITQRSLSVTSSPSIDILRASNIERFLYFIHDGDSDKVRTLMQRLDKEKRFALDAAVFESRLKGMFWAGKCPEARCRAVVKALFTASEGHRLFDPHTGVAAAVVEDYIAYVKDTTKDGLVPIVLASTAHWGKFPEPVMASLGIALPAGGADLSVVQHVQAMHSTIQAQCPNAQPVPASLREAVAAPHKAVPMVMPAPSYEAIVEAMMAFANQPVA